MSQFVIIAYHLHNRHNIPSQFSNCAMSRPSMQVKLLYSTERQFSELREIGEELIKLDEVQHSGFLMPEALLRVISRGLCSPSLFRVSPPLPFHCAIKFNVNKFIT
jgi:hypothetical protein